VRETALELPDYENKPIPSIGEDRWKGMASKKGKPAFKGQNLSHQPIVTIIQFFSSNYAPPRPKKKG